MLCGLLIDVWGWGLFKNTRGGGGEHTAAGRDAGGVRICKPITVFRFVEELQHFLARTNVDRHDWCLLLAKWAYLKVVLTES